MCVCVYVCVWNPLHCSMYTVQEGSVFSNGTNVLSFKLLVDASSAGSDGHKSSSSFFCI